MFGVHGYRRSFGVYQPWRSLLFAVALTVAAIAGMLDAKQAGAGKSEPCGRIALQSTTCP